MTNLFVRNPATGALLATLKVDDADSVNTKLQAGARAFKTWKKTSAYERAALLMKWAELIILHKVDIAKVMTEEKDKIFKDWRHCEFTSCHVTTTSFCNSLLNLC